MAVANYNLGVIKYIEGDYKSADEYFNKYIINEKLKCDEENQAVGNIKLALYKYDDAIISTSIYIMARTSFFYSHLNSTKTTIFNNSNPSKISRSF